MGWVSVNLGRESLLVDRTVGHSRREET